MGVFRRPVREELPLMPKYHIYSYKIGGILEIEFQAP